MLCMLMYMFVIRTGILFWSVWCSDLESAFPRELIGHSLPYAWLQDFLKSHALAPKQRYRNFPYYPRRMLRYRNQILSLQSCQSDSVTMETISWIQNCKGWFSLSPFTLFLFPSCSVPCLYLISPLGGDPNETWLDSFSQLGDFLPSADLLCISP